ncbi:transposase [Salinisphaera sp. G21_0]|uniref:IS66 family transposase n=1 Tax=Salinisphaera sp. G21_0 TaxID=2821094 RepID=UPI001ADB0BAF|nr:transposase [Salinisphaera sp. G21_0]MBO9482685.1 transposase [Salinisphaera sp. G21_0]
MISNGRSIIGEGEGTLVCDRYSAYKKLAKDHPLIFLAFCWAHVRRDFIDACRGDSDLYKWSTVWVNRIGRLYYLNEQRLLVRNDPQQWLTRQLRLEKQVELITSQRDQELTRPRLAPKARKVLESLANHWEGLVRFIQNPDVPMDNNIAEQTLRGPVVGRKNYYGSGSEWSTELAAWLFTVLTTLKLWKINQKLWLTGYLEACIANDRQPPEDLSQWIPWLMDESRLNELRIHDPPAS